MLKKKFVANSRFTKERANISIESECDNSFLIEVPHNTDIDLNLRKQIDLKYQQSQTNNYAFPRTNSSKLSLHLTKRTLGPIKPLAVGAPVRSSGLKGTYLKKSASLLTKPKKVRTPANPKLKSVRKDSNKTTLSDLSTATSKSKNSSTNPSVTSSLKSIRKTCLRKLRKK